MAIPVMGAPDGEWKIPALKDVKPVRWEPGFVKIERWYGNCSIGYLHVGKAGGTAVRSLLSGSIRGSLKKPAHDNGGSSPTKFLHQGHFDYSFWEKTSKGLVGRGYNAPRLVAHFRDPVERAISNFFHLRRMSWARGTKFGDASLSEAINDFDLLMNVRSWWRDGMGGAFYLAGLTDTGTWMSISEHELKRPVRQHLGLSPTFVLERVAQHLEELLWFGFLEDQERGFTMLAWQLGLDSVPRLSHQNKTPSKGPVTDDDKAKLRSLLPLDSWTVNYARLIFEARWKQFSTGEAVPAPQRPAYPESLSCYSLKQWLHCEEDSALGYVHFNFDRKTRKKNKDKK